MTIELNQTVTETEGRKIVLRTQAQHDVDKLVRVCPKDQSLTFVGSWSGGTFVLDPATVIPITGKEMVEMIEAGKPDTIPLPVPTPDMVADPTVGDDGELARVAALNDADLHTLAAERGVKINAKWSRETLVAKVAGKK